jgi:cobalt-zinc-cadmium efflux system outer membrane protein
MFIFLKPWWGRVLVVESQRLRLLEQILETSRSEAELYRARVQAGDATEQDAVEAAVQVQKAGKGELLRVLTARRDLALLRTRRLEMIRREWGIVSQAAALTGDLP